MSRSNINYRIVQLREQWNWSINKMNHNGIFSLSFLDHLKTDNHPISHWYYGHFHQSWHSAIDGILYQMLDIMEFCQIY